MKRIFHYYKIYLTILKSYIMMAMINRLDFVIWSIVHALQLVIEIIFFQAIYLRTPTIGGWTMYEVLVLLGIMEMTLGIGGLTFFPMMYGFSEMIRKGELDWRLVKPVDIQFLITFPWIDYSDSLSIITGAGVASYALFHMHVDHFLLSFFLFLCTYICGLLILYSLLVLLLSLAFKSTTLTSLHNFFWSFLWIGRYPVSVFKGILHFIFLFVMPLGLVGSLPAQTLVGHIDIPLTLFSFCFAGILFWFSRLVFLSNIKHYSSASS